MTVYSPRIGVRRATELLATLEDPHHRAIIANYRRHALLEIAGRWPEILAPELTVEHPVYRISVDGVMRTLSGRAAVAAFYRGLTEAGRTVFGPIEQRLVVADWGFAAEATFQRHAPGATLLRHHPDLDPDATYRVEWPVASFWHYTDDARLIGEHVYACGDETVAPAEPGAGMTFEQARDEAEALLEARLPTLVPTGDHR